MNQRLSISAEVNMKTKIFAYLVIFFIVLILWPETAAAAVLKEGKEVVAGRHYHFNSKILNEQRTITVWLPKDYETSGNSYPVFYLLDGEIQFFNISGIVESLSRFSHIPGMILVAVTNTDRERDFLPYQIKNWPPVPGANKFRRFLKDELIPLVDVSFRTTTYRILSGHSHGGLFCIHCFLKEPDIFTAYIAISPSLNRDDMRIPALWSKVLEKTSFKKKFFFLATSGDDYPESVEPTRKLAAELKRIKPKGLEWRFDFMEEDDHMTVVHPVIFNALRWLHQGWRISEMAMRHMTLAEIEHHYREYSKWYGSEVKMPEGALFNYGYILLDNNKIEQAIQAFKKTIELYPDSAASYLGLGETYEESNRLPEALKSYENAVRIASKTNDRMVLPTARGLLTRAQKKLKINEPGIPSRQEIENHFKGQFQAGLIIGLLVDGEEKIYCLGTKINGMDRPIDQFTTFEIGSITKTFTATILADLELKGLIDPKSDFLNYFPPQYQKSLEETCGGITLHHLVTHTSGIPAMPSNLGDIRQDPTLLEKYDVSQLVDFLKSCKLDFAPGTSHRYSNLGVSILGYILARSQNSSYEDLVKKHIFIPLGMNRSSLFLSDVQRENMALGHNRQGERESYWNATQIFQGSGFIKSTLFDMMIYLKTYMGLITNPLTKAAELASRPVAKGYPDTEICYAWYKEKIDENLYITCHNGSTGGFYSFIGYTHPKRFGLVLLCNSKITRELEALVYELFKKFGKT